MSELTLSNPANTDLQEKIANVAEELKKIDSRLSFAPNGVLEKWEMCP